jgi:putative endonuclease
MPLNDAERRAALLYRLRGYRILATNAWAGGYELDVVARRGSTVVFVEVKAKSGEGFGDPLDMVDGEKQRRIHRAAEIWLAQHPEIWLAQHPELARCRVRFDAVAERSGRLARVADAF